MIESGEAAPAPYSSSLQNSNAHGNMLISPVTSNDIQDLAGKPQLLSLDLAKQNGFSMMIRERKIRYFRV